MTAEDEQLKEAVFSSSEVTEVAQLWRRAWSDRSRSEMVLKAGPGFFLWRSKLDGRRSSGMFYARSLIGDVIADSGMADEVRRLIDELDHQQSVVAVLGFEDEGNATVITVAKLEPPFKQIWFEMPEIRRRSLASAVWVPLRASQKLLSAGDYGYEGYREEYFGVGSAMFPSESHEKAIRLEWTDLGIGQSYTGGQITHYLPPGEHSDARSLIDLRIPFSQARFRGLLDVPSPERKEVTTLLWAGDIEASRSDEIGTGLVIDQHLNSKESSVWHLHQDFVISLGLMREGDVWVRPEEGYLEIARLTRASTGEPVLLEVRAEHLRDYLCARQSNLYVSSYRSRREVTQVRAHIDWDPTPRIEHKDFSKW